MSLQATHLLLLGEVPSPDGLVGAGRIERLAVGREHHLVNVAAMSFEAGRQIGGGNVLQADRAIREAVAGGQETTVE